MLEKKVEERQMAEYIDRNLIEWYGCDYEKDLDCENRECSSCSHAKGSHAQVMQIPPADVVEHSKIDKAIEEMERIISDTSYVYTSEGVKLALKILKRNIGE